MKINLVWVLMPFKQLYRSLISLVLVGMFIFLPNTDTVACFPEYDECKVVEFETQESNKLWQENEENKLKTLDFDAISGFYTNSHTNLLLSPPYLTIPKTDLFHLISSDLYLRFCSLKIACF